MNIWKIKIIGLFLFLVNISSCITFYSLHSYNSDKSERLLEIHMENQSFIMDHDFTSYPYPPAHWTPAYIGNNPSYRFYIKTNKYDEIENIVIHEWKIIYNNIEYDILNRITLMEGDVKYYRFGEKEYKIFLETFQLIISPNDTNIEIVIGLPKKNIKNLNIRIVMTINYKNGVNEEKYYLTHFRKKIDRGVWLYY